MAVALGHYRVALSIDPDSQAQLYPRSATIDCRAFELGFALFAPAAHGLSSLSLKPLLLGHPRFLLRDTRHYLLKDIPAPHLASSWSRPHAAAR